jgi:hypothetical protein
MLGINALDDNTVVKRTKLHGSSSLEWWTFWIGVRYGRHVAAFLPQRL